MDGKPFLFWTDGRKGGQRLELRLGKPSASTINLPRVRDVNAIAANVLICPCLSLAEVCSYALWSFLKSTHGVKPVLLLPTRYESVL